MREAKQVPVERNGLQSPTGAVRAGFGILRAPKEPLKVFEQQ